MGSRIHPWAAWALMTGLVTAPALAGVPPTEKKPVREVLHGVEIVDPYRWLEGSAAPELAEPDETLDRRVSSWTDAQNAYTRQMLDGLPGRRALEDRLREVMGTSTIGSAERAGERIFYARRAPAEAQAAVWVREADGSERVVVDPNALDADGLTSLDWWQASPDGKRLGFGLFRAGDENTVAYVLDVDREVWLADEIEGKVRGVSWLPDGSGFVYRRLADSSDPYSGQVRFHRVGLHPRQDPVLYEQVKEGPLATTWGPYAELSEDGRWLILLYWTGTDSNDLYVADFARWLRDGELDLRPVVEGEDAQSVAVAAGDSLFMRTTLGAPNGRLVKVDLTALAAAGPGADDAGGDRRRGWSELAPERPDASLYDVDLAAGRVLASYIREAVTAVEVYSRDGERLGAVELPGLGTSEIQTVHDSSEIFLAFESFAHPRTLYRVDLETGKRETFARTEVEIDSGAFEVRQVRYPSKDGTSVPMFLVHRRGIERDGSHPVILSGYGGFNISLTPDFDATLLPWLEAGGIYAQANLRGGGELGEEWHRAGMLENKQNVFDDFVAAGEWLVREGYTRPERLGIAGGSNGGLLTGAALTQRPDLFAAVVCGVPLLDMLRYQNFLMARYWVPEYGSAEEAEQFRYIYEYSPYHHVEDGVRYPAVLLTAGENDARVHPLHARKMAARLQAATAGDPQADPVLLWVDRRTGHGAGRPLADRIRDAADKRIFMMWQLGLLDAAVMKTEREPLREAVAVGGVD